MNPTDWLTTPFGWDHATWNLLHSWILWPRDQCQISPTWRHTRHDPLTLNHHTPNPIVRIVELYIVESAHGSHGTILLWMTKMWLKIDPGIPPQSFNLLHYNIIDSHTGSRTLAVGMCSSPFLRENSPQGPIRDHSPCFIVCQTWGSRKTCLFLLKTILSWILWAQNSPKTDILRSKNLPFEWSDIIKTTMNPFLNDELIPFYMEQPTPVTIAPAALRRRNAIARLEWMGLL